MLREIYEILACHVLPVGLLDDVNSYLVLLLYLLNTWLSDDVCRPDDVVSRNISLFVIDFSATKLNERVMYSIASDHLNNLGILLIQSNTLFPLQIVVEHIPHLNGCSLLPCNRSWSTALVIDHHTIGKVSDIGKL